MKLSNEISDLLIELVDIESADYSQLLEANMGLLYNNLLELYGKTSNCKSQELIISIIDKSGYSLFGPRSGGTEFNNAESTHELINVHKGFDIDEDDFMDLLPINGFFH